MPVKGLIRSRKPCSPVRTYVSVRYRLRGTVEIYQLLNELAGANRYLWNASLAQVKRDYQETGKAKTSFNALCKWYREHKHHSAPWLTEYAAALTRTGLKDLSKALKEFFKGDKGRPDFKKKGVARKSFAVDVSGINRSRFTDNGYFRLKRGLFAKMLNSDRVNRYSNPVPKSARIFEEFGNWYLTVHYEVDGLELETDDLGVGVDRNVGQVVDTAQNIHYLTNVIRHFDRIQFLQRRLAKQTRKSNRWKKTKRTIARHSRKIAHIRENDLRHIAKLITSISTLVFLEDLKTKNMTKSAKGTMEQPGKNVKAKAGLNREILKTAWGMLEQFLKERGFVHKVTPAYTSQTCSKCGYVDTGNRKAQSAFKCLSCGFELNADINAAINIWTSGLASINGRGAYVSPVLARQNGRRVLKRQNEQSDLGYSCI